MYNINVIYNSVIYINNRLRTFGKLDLLNFRKSYLPMLVKTGKLTIRVDTKIIVRETRNVLVNIYGRKARLEEQRSGSEGRFKSSMLFVSLTFVKVMKYDRFMLW